jgi:1-acyl-sn-glycerol-3-phosphate acyltransferase
VSDVPHVPALVRVAARMNAEPAKTLWTLYLRAVGARLVHRFTRHVLHVDGLEWLAGVSRDRPLLLAANHRSFYDMFVVSSVLLRRVPGPWRIYFPVRGRYCYHSWRGAALNALAAGWSMYPPFYREPGTRALDALMLDRLTALLREGPGRVVGFHPEGTRNRGTDPWALLPPLPGIGQLVLRARPQLVPVFVAGLDNDPRAQLRANRPGGPPMRVRFGAPVPADAYADVPDRMRGHLAIAHDVMRRIGELAAADRAVFGGDVAGDDGAVTAAAAVSS